MRAYYSFMVRALLRKSPTDNSNAVIAECAGTIYMKEERHHTSPGPVIRRRRRRHDAPLKPDKPESIYKPMAVSATQKFPNVKETKKITLRSVGYSRRGRYQQATWPLTLHVPLITPRFGWNFRLSHQRRLQNKSRNHECTRTQSGPNVISSTLILCQCYAEHERMPTQSGPKMKYLYVRHRRGG